MFPLPHSDDDNSSSECEEEPQPLPDNSIKLWSLLGERTGSFKDICTLLQDIESSSLL